ncbi:MAG: hypothetical protein HRT92_10090 [Piscirickettsiaceae bacterium]|nr:hypothetical protein [Piscirickettsiaceae bacterium]
MNKHQHKMTVAIHALRGAAAGIASAMEDESISSDEVHGLLSTLADRFDELNNKMVRKTRN